MRYIHTHDTIHMVHFVPVRLDPQTRTQTGPHLRTEPLSLQPPRLSGRGLTTREAHLASHRDRHAGRPRLRSPFPASALREPGLPRDTAPRGTDLRHRPCARRADGRLTGCVPPCLPSRPDPSIQANPLHPGVGAHSRSGCARAINRRAQPQWLRACLEPRSYRAQGAGAV